jgi:hypothetical protein
MLTVAYTAPEIINGGAVFLFLSLKADANTSFCCSTAKWDEEVRRRNINTVSGLALSRSSEVSSVDRRSSLQIPSNRG